jgi:diadenosine tetraphosphate (Ap4A) HIT family hydrolase
MSNLSEAERYGESCPFCKIVAAFPPAADTDSEAALAPQAPDAALVEPKCFLVLSAPEVLAFLDILPMTTGHLLVTTRSHREKLGDVPPEEGQAIGMYTGL